MPTDKEVSKLWVLLDLDQYEMLEKGSKKTGEGRAVGKCIGSGKANILTSLAQSEFSHGEVAEMTGPDLKPIMKKAGCSKA